MRPIGWLRWLAEGLCSSALLCDPAPTLAQEAPVVIQVDAQVAEGELRPVWSYFGYDEPNYTYAENGKKLLGELRQLSPTSVYVRVHNLLTSGDGSASLKWGSTNAYAEDAAGKPIYEWKIVDRIFDTFRQKGVTPLVEVGFMPEALSVHPQPYRHDFPKGSVFTGWTYPPRDYAKWEELVYQFTKHLRERYGDAEIKSWLWEVWNEPDIDYWRGSREEFFKLYDYAAEGILRGAPGAKVGGPDTTGAAGRNAGEFLRAFLEHCARGSNEATGKKGSPLSFISFHPKGAPKWQADHVQMGLGRQLLSVQKGFQVIAEFPEWRATPVILGEWDPEGCAACSAKNHPENAYRNGELYAAYTAEALHDTLALATNSGVNLVGVVTWSFEFEDQAYFEGFRELATNGIDKPVLNAFRMFGMLGNERLRLTSSAASPSENVLNPGNTKIEGINGFATRKAREVEVLVWNYQEEDVAGPSATVSLSIAGLPETAKKAKMERFRVDRENGNAYTAWQKMGRPEKPSRVQYTELEAAGKLKMDGSPEWAEPYKGKYELRLELPRQGLVLVRLTW
jgi:xylan 1,4-beta-xylosidase